MKKLFALVLMLSAIVFGQPYNSTMLVDTVYVKGTETKYSKIFWQDDIANKSVLVVLDDTSAAGRANDSASMSIELMQVFTDQFGTKNKYAFVMSSLANPDSTTWPGSSSFKIFDSLNIKSMDTLSLFAKKANPIARMGDTTGWTYTSKIDSLVPASLRVAAKYRAIAPDFSPGVTFKLTGNSANKKASAVRVLIYYCGLLFTK